MLKVGLTGGIGCGKTTVTRLFQQYGVPVIDADQIARELVEPGQGALQKISDVLGKQFIKADGQLNRSLLKESIFSDNHQLEQLESILHPAIRQEVVEQMLQYQCKLSPPSYIIVDVPLLVEKGYQDLFDEVVVVDCDEQQQIERASQRDNMDEQAVRAIMHKQTGRKERLEIATETLDNTGSVEALTHQVEALHKIFSLQESL